MPILQSAIVARIFHNETKPKNANITELQNTKCSEMRNESLYIDTNNSDDTPPLKTKKRSDYRKTSECGE